MTHICRFLPHKTQSTGREYRACPICGNTPAVQIEGEFTNRERLVFLDKPDSADTQLATTSSATAESASVRQGTEPCYFDLTGESDRAKLSTD